VRRGLCGRAQAWGLGRPAARAPAAFHSRRLRRRARASLAPCRASPSAKARRPSASVACVLTKLVNVRVRHARRRRKARGDALRARTAGVAWAPAARLLAAHRPMPPPRGPPAVARPRRICRATGLQCCGRVFPDCRVAGFSRIAGEQPSLKCSTATRSSAANGCVYQRRDNGVARAVRRRQGRRGGCLLEQGRALTFRAQPRALPRNSKDAHHPRPGSPRPRSPRHGESPRPPKPESQPESA